jgi:hypothetical protein
MRYTITRLMACLAAASVAILGTAHATEGTTAAVFGSTVAATWSGVELACPDGSHEWMGATPDTLYCFRVAMSGLSTRARLTSFLEHRGIWLNAWQLETPEMMSRPFWSGGDLFRIIVATSHSAPRTSVVFIRHMALH